MGIRATSLVSCQLGISEFQGFMGLLDRAWRTIRANVNNLIEANEDPEQRLERVVAQMHAELLSLRQAVARAIATHKRTERQRLLLQAVAEDWHRRAQRLLEQGNETLAREALTYRQTHLKTARVLQERLAQQSEVIQQMRTNLRQLEQKIAEARMKKEMFVARVRSAEARRRLYELSDGSVSGHSQSAFELMENKVMQLEAEVQLIVESSQERLDENVSSLEDIDQVEAELRVMQAQKLPSEENRF